MTARFGGVPSFGRSPGISALIASQNSERTIRASVSSFASECDEVVVVDNGSTDATLHILEDLSHSLPNVAVISRPDIHHLHENRQTALEASHYQWVVRADSDWVLSSSALEDSSDRTWRDEILRFSSNPFVWSRSIANVNYVCNRYLARDESVDWPIARYVPSRLTSYRWRVLRFSPLLNFVRRGRWESISYPHVHALLERRMSSVYVAHYEFKSDLDFFLRSERTNWREQGDFQHYPNLEAYVFQKYSCTSQNDLDSVSREYVRRSVYPALSLVGDCFAEPLHSYLLRP